MQPDRQVPALRYLMTAAVAWVVALAALVVAGFALRFGLRERRRRKGRPTWDRSKVELVEPQDIDPVFRMTTFGLSRDSEVLLVGDSSELASTSAREAWILSALAKSAQTIFEFGTYSGRTTYLLARNAPENARVGTITLRVDDHDDYRVDPSDPDSTRWRSIALRESVFERFYYSDTGVEPKIEQIFGDSKAFDESAWHNRCDIVFIDGSHAYSYVKNDSEKAFKMVRPGGIVLWHDFSPACPGVWRYLSELAAAGHPVRHIRHTILGVLRIES